MNTLMPETQGPSLEDAPGLTEDELDQLVIDDYSQNEAICPKGGSYLAVWNIFEL